MDVSEIQARRELEYANRLMRQREEDHSREVQNLRDNYRQQIDQLEDQYSEELSRKDRKSENTLTDVRKHYDEEIQRATDSYESTLSKERRESYDRLGRMQGEHSRERMRDNEIRSKQFRDLTDQSNRDVDSERKEREQNIAKIRDDAEKSKSDLKQHFDASIESHKQSSANALATTTEAARKKIEDNIRRTGEQVNNERMGAELRYRKLADESRSERDTIKKAYAGREQRLLDEKKLSELRRGTDGAKELDGFRKQVADAYARQNEEQKFLAARKDREFADRLAQSATDYDRRLQERTAQFRRAETELQNQLDVEKNKSAIDDALREKRHKQDVFLSSDALRRSQDLATQIMATQYSDQLAEAEDRASRRANAQQLEAQKRIADQDLRGNAERQQVQQQKAQELTELHMKHGAEKKHIQHAFEQRAESMDELRKRQLEDQKTYLGKAINDARGEANKMVYQNSLENQAKLFELQELLKNRNAEFEMQRRIDNDQAEHMQRERAKRLAETYSQALAQTKDSFDEASHSYKHETMLRLAKQRGDAEHEKRMQLLELTAKNRELMASFETKLNQVEDLHHAELSKLKVDHEKAMRDVMKKAKDMVDVERDVHRREMESKELQSKEKLKLQELSFRDQIEKLKRTNEHTIKKS
jgi:hypothetical protein